jgi:hypothetical protein
VVGTQSPALCSSYAANRLKVVSIPRHSLSSECFSVITLQPTSSNRFEPLQPPATQRHRARLTTANLQNAGHSNGPTKSCQNSLLGLSPVPHIWLETALQSGIDAAQMRATQPKEAALFLVGDPVGLKITSTAVHNRP